MGGMHDAAPKSRYRFATTEWSVVLAARDPEEPGFRSALSDLCRRYWYPVYAHVRGQGASADEAQDLTQGFFADLLERNALGCARPERGRFRAFLKTCLNNFLSNQRDRDRTRKRGGHVAMIPLEWDEAERLYELESRSDGDDPARAFEKRWALTVLANTMERLRDEVRKSRRPETSLALLPCLTGDLGTMRYREVATELGLSESVVKVRVHRLRRRYGELLRSEIAGTLADPERADEEIRALFSAIQ
ncbi:MAG: sigma-70 family RNA polymerase sigma factor [bacterium]|nr:sigma-70 family RNA polymerase sigma factor [bacterium]